MPIHLPAIHDRMTEAGLAASVSAPALDRDMRRLLTSLPVEQG